MAVIIYDEREQLEQQHLITTIFRNKQLQDQDSIKTSTDNSDVISMSMNAYFYKKIFKRLVITA